MKKKLKLRKVTEEVKKMKAEVKKSGKSTETVLKNPRVQVNLE